MLANILDSFGNIAGLILIATAVVHVILAWGVYGDAHALLLEKQWLYLLQPWGWALTTLVTGILGAAVYWLINRSTLRRDEERPPATGDDV
jgi:hypothetical protein